MIELRPVSVQDSGASGKYYDQLYGRHFSGWETGQILSRYMWLIELLRARPGQAVLDVSCGNGYLLSAAMRQGLAGYGVDISTVAIEQAKCMAPDAIAFCGDAEVLPLADNSFDYVVNVGSLEHYLHPSIGAAEMARVLKPGGKAVILVPNAYGLFGNILHVWQKGDVFIDDQPLQRYATRGWWQRLLENGGFTVVKTVGYDRELPRTWRDLGAYLRHPTRLMRAILSPLIPVNLADSLVFLCDVAEK